MRVIELLCLDRVPGQRAGRRPGSAISVRPVIPLSSDLALSSADVGLCHGLATADAIVYATALSTQAELVTRDAHFRDLPGVAYLG